MPINLPGPDGQPITVAYGDGVGPEIMDATLRVLKASGARLRLEEIEIGEKMYLGGFSSGISPEAWDTLRRNKVFLKGAAPFSLLLSSFPALLTYSRCFAPAARVLQPPSPPPLAAVTSPSMCPSAKPWDCTPMSAPAWPWTPS